MGTSRVCFKFLKFNVLWINWLALFSFRILYCFTVFEAVLKRFQRVSAGGSVPLEKNTRLAGSKSNRRTAKAKIFPRNGHNRLKSRSAEEWITRFPVCRSLVHKSHRNGLKIARLPAQICLSRCCIMRKPTVVIPDLKSKLSDRIRSTKLALGRGGKEQLPTCKLRLKEAYHNFHLAE